MINLLLTEMYKTAIEKFRKARLALNKKEEEILSQLQDLEKNEGNNRSI